MRNEQKGHKEIPSLIGADGAMAETNKEKAELLNETFTNVFTHGTKMPPTRVQQPPVQMPLVTINVDEQTVYKSLLRAKSKCSAGDDGIPSIVLRRCALMLAEPLSALFQLSLDSGTVPHDWKTAVVTAIPKKPPANRPGNYRPIAITSAVSRTLDRIIKDVIVKHCEDNHILSNYQHGFRARRSTISNLLQCDRDWAQLATARRECIDCIYIDFANAFPTVGHNILLQKLEAIGIGGALLRLIKSTLTGRVQCTQVNGIRSKWTNVTSSVTQGSVTGPIYYAIFLDDLLKKITRAKCAAFADDIKLYSNDPLALQHDLNVVCEWAQTNDVQIATAKCAHLPIGAPAGRIFTINGQAVETVDHMRDLGVLVDGQLSFDHHINDIVKRAHVRSIVLLKTFARRDRAFLLRLFITYIRPLVEYASAVWNPTSVATTRKLESVQRRFTKLVLRNGPLSYAERLKELGLESLKQRRANVDLITMFNMISGELFYNRDSLPIGTRGRLQQPLVHNERERRHFHIRTIAGFNLSQQARQAQTITAFRTHLNN